MKNGLALESASLHELSAAYEGWSSPMSSDRSIIRPAPLPSPSLAEDVLQAVQTLVVVANGEGQIVYAAPAVERILGYQPEEVLGDGWWTKVIRPESSSASKRRARAAREARGEVPVQNEPYVSRLYNKSGEERWVQWHDSKGPGDLLI